MVAPFLAPAATPLTAALAALAHGDAPSALRLAADAVTHEAGNPDAYLTMANAAQALGDAGTALRALDMAHTLAPGRPDVATLRLLALAFMPERKEDIGALILADFALEDQLASLFRTLYGNPEGVPLGFDWELRGVRLRWPIPTDAAARERASEIYHWIPLLHNSPRAAAAFYRDYDRYAAGNDARTERLAALVCDRMRLQKGDAVLDAGIGTGGVLAQLVARYGVRPYGFDMAPEAADLARRRLPDLEFASGDLESLPFEDGRFRGILCTDTLEHTVRPHRVVAELVRVLAPGGHLLVSVPDGRFDAYLGHVSFHTTQSLGALLMEHGEARVTVHADGLMGELWKPA